MNSNEHFPTPVERHLREAATQVASLNGNSQRTAWGQRVPNTPQDSGPTIATWRTSPRSNEKGPGVNLVIKTQDMSKKGTARAELDRENAILLVRDISNALGLTADDIFPKE